MELNKYLHPENIIYPLRGKNLSGVYLELLNIFKVPKIHRKAKEIAEELSSQDTDFNFIISPGISLPHLRMKGINDIKIAVGLSPTGLKTSLNNVLLHLFFLEIAPIKAVDQHIFVIAEIARLTEKLSINELLSSVVTSFDLYSKLNALYYSLETR